MKITKFSNEKRNFISRKKDRRGALSGHVFASISSLTLALVYNESESATFEKKKKKKSFKVESSGVSRESFVCRCTCVITSATT